MNLRQIYEETALAYRLIYVKDNKVFPSLYCERELNIEELKLIEEVLHDTMVVTGQ